MLLLASCRRRSVLDMHDLYSLGRGQRLCQREVTASCRITLEKCPPPLDSVDSQTPPKSPLTAGVGVEALCHEFDRFILCLTGVMLAAAPR